MYAVNTNHKSKKLCYDKEDCKLIVGTVIFSELYSVFTGACPGFLVRVGANLRGGAPTYKFARFPPKNHEI